MRSSQPHLTRRASSLSSTGKNSAERTCTTRTLGNKCGGYVFSAFRNIADLTRRSSTKTKPRRRSLSSASWLQDRHQQPSKIDLLFFTRPVGLSAAVTSLSAAPREPAQSPPNDLRWLSTLCSSDCRSPLTSLDCGLLGQQRVMRSGLSSRQQLSDRATIKG